jgi:signal transduction histidine kinase
MAKVSPVPIYAPTNLYVGSGIVGGMMRDAQATGTRVGQIARQVLDANPPQVIQMVKVPAIPMFDWRQVKRWGIDPARLPKGSEIRFRPRNVWQDYRWYILGAILVVMVQLVLIAALLAQRTKRQRAEEGIRANETELFVRHERIRQLAGRLISAQEATRAGIAQDLHDDVCQRLVYLNMAVASLKNSSGDLHAPQTQTAFSEIERDASAVFDGIRRLSHDLHPSSLRILGLVPALRAHCLEVEKRHGVGIIFTVDGDVGSVDPDTALCLFRIAQEALRNGLIHGAAQMFIVTLERSGQHVTLFIKDDGVGFDLEAVRHKPSGLGVVSMDERAHLVGGQVEIVTARRHGTSVRVRVPATRVDTVAAS